MFIKPSQKVMHKEELDHVEELKSVVLRLVKATAAALDDLVRGSGGAVAHVTARRQVNLLRELAREIENDDNGRKRQHRSL